MSTEKETLEIPANLAGMRLDKALAEMFPRYSRSRLKDWLLQGAITVDSGLGRPKDAVAGGERVTLVAPDAVEVEARPEPMSLAVAFEDEHLLVIDKPAGLVVHPGAGNPDGTLLNGLLHHAPALEAVPRAGIVHRIDKDTTGLLLVAKTLEAHTQLVRMLEQRLISRRYQAVCYGELTGGGSIDAPLGRHPVDRKRMTVREGGKPAVTHYTVRERFTGFTHVDVALETGRTHQIRVHFAHRQQPLVGDPVYGRRLAVPKGASPALAEQLRRFRRQALHAARLAFEHPISGHSIDCAADLPADLEALLHALRGNAA